MEATLAADSPPSQAPAAQQSGGKVVGFDDVLEVACESKMLSGSGWLDRCAEPQMLERLRERRPAEVA